MSFICEQPFAIKVYFVGLEQVAGEQNQADLLLLLLDTVSATLAAEETVDRHEITDDRGEVVIESLRRSIRESSRTRIFALQQRPPELEEIRDGRSLVAVERWKEAIGT